MSPKVSILISCYNVEKFLQSGLDCVINQTYKNIEVILVNDGSTDGSGKLCENIAKTDERVKAFHKENGGLGSARNIGLDQATGTYIYFYDVDDQIELDLIEKNVKLAEEHHVDMVMFGMNIYTVKYNQKDVVRFNQCKILSNDMLKNVFAGYFIFVKHGNGFVWNKFYRKSFIDKYGFKFGEQRIQQDEVFNINIYRKIERVYISNDILYHYYLYPTGGASSRYFTNKFDIVTEVFDNFIDFYNGWELHDSRILDYIYRRYMSGIFNVLSYNFYHKDCNFSFMKRYQEINKIINNPKVIHCVTYCRNGNTNIFMFCIRYKLVLSFMLLNRTKIILKKLLRK